MGLGQLYISLETSVLCEDWIYRGNIMKKYKINARLGPGIYYSASSTGRT